MVSIPVIAMASISFYVAFYHLLIYLRRRQFREHLTFALLCFTVVLYDAFCVGLYNASSIIEGEQWQRLQFISLTMLVPAFLWFVSTYTNQKPGLVLYSYSLYYLIAFLVQLIDRTNLTFLSGQPALKNISFAGFRVTYYEVTLGIFSSAQSVVGLVASIYILIMVFRYYRSGHTREAMPLILATGLMYAASVHDTLVGNGVYQFIYLMEYAYLATIITMTSSLSKTVVEAAIAKEELKKSEERFRSLVETTSDWVWEVDANGKYTYASPRVRDLLGYEPGEILEHTPFDFMSPGEAKSVGRTFQSIMQNRGVFKRVENVNLHKNGQPVVLETSGIPFFNEEGELLGYRGIDRDITERRQIENKLRISEERLQHVVRISNIGIFDHDHITDSVYWSTDVRNSFGIAQDEIYSLSDFIKQLHPEDLEATGLAIQRAHNPAGDGSFDVEYRFIRRDGTIRWFAAKSKTYFDGDGDTKHPVRTIGALIDITERKQTEEERETLIKELEAKNAELERFTYTVSHDLRSPLVTIKGFLGFLKQDFTSRNEVRFLSDVDRIGSATVKMDLLLRDLLELSRIGRLINPSELVPFESLVQDAMEMVHGQLEARGVTLHIGNDLPVVYVDRRRLVEVLQNLLDNATKFMGDQSNPCIEVGQCGKDGKNPIFFVKDNGVGFSPEYREHVFGLFNKLEPKTEGSGIGLALVKRIVELHGGRVWVDSEKGKGSTFYFTLADSARELP